MGTFSALLAICAGNSPVTGEFPNKGQWCGALMFSLIWINGWVNNGGVGDLKRHCAHYDATVMLNNIRLQMNTLTIMSEMSDVKYPNTMGLRDALGRHCQSSCVISLKRTVAFLSGKMCNMGVNPNVSLCVRSSEMVSNTLFWWDMKITSKVDKWWILYWPSNLSVMKFQMDFNRLFSITVFSYWSFC